ncbi:hypothetical protein PV04_02834 [Phialophora macrospora]|uniref:TEA domain-containing protein n=1 Tax=Phialophora macrospora TaxID=1851006 RepID=A0A0D2FQJ8_9EURO|nr:hypothetical protein PV04_02834 [Phialophora macrospora]
MECIPSGMSSSLHFGDSRSAGEHLSVSSGNVQLLPVQHREGIENQYPLPALSSGRQTPQQFPIPSLKLGSNDDSHHGFTSKPRRHPLRPRRTRLADPDRPYLVHPKYIEYRSRPRQDIGKDGKPIWPDHIEAAFQDALVHIKPMGRKKCSQRGKPYGRNMLIAEWIYRATGHKRERKQVSSHIQVLDRFLAGIPEWDRLIKPSDDDDVGPTEGHKFYHNSIEHMVNEQKARSKVRQHGGTAWDDDLDEADDSLGPGIPAIDSNLSHPVEQLNFEMWVSSPVDPDRALHCYSKLKADKLAAMPLEDLAGWRLSFPHLKSQVDRGNRLHNCDLILLNTSFKLMQEFPPRYSKLGIGLELKFPDPLLWPETNGDLDFKKWTCTTYMYRDGVLISEPSREECQVSEHWKVRPFFQSKWWASTFTSLTEARKVAEDTKDPNAIEHAKEQSRGFFRGLSIMQEISAVRCVGGWQTKQDKRTRMAILLWKFSQADSVGTTTWQNLIAPPDRVTTNSPPPPGAELDLPPLSIDSIVSPGNGSFESNNQFLSQHSMQYHVYPDAMDEELCHDGFMGLKPEQMDIGHLQSFDMSLHGYSGVDPALHDTFELQHGGLRTTAANQHSIDANLFEPTHAQESLQSGMNGPLFDDNQPVPSGHTQDLPLSRFDVTTHQVLQEHLNAEDSQSTSASHLPSVKTEPSPSLHSEVAERRWSQQVDEDEKILHILATQRQQQQQQQQMAQTQPRQAWPAEVDEHQALRHALLGASSMTGIRATPRPHQAPRPQHHFANIGDQQQMHEGAHRVSPMSFRPPLQSYHSFPGKRSDDHVHRVPFGAEHHVDGLPLSHRLSEIDGHHFLNHHPSAVSAPEDFIHASDPLDEGSRSFTRAHSEPDASAAAAIECFSSSMSGELQAHADSSSLAPTSTPLGGNSVDVSMVDVQGIL